MQSVEDAVKPTQAQAGDLKNLEDATDKAVSIMQAACPDETPLTPPGRLAAMEKRLQAMSEAAKTVKPALDSFYASLSNEQKARFNRIKRRAGARRLNALTRKRKRAAIVAALFYCRSRSISRSPRAAWFRAR